MLKESSEVEESIEIRMLLLPLMLRARLVPLCTELVCVHGR